MANMISNLAGKQLKELYDLYHKSLFDDFLPFWDKGGLDKEFGGVICELNEDGSVFDSDKLSTFQGRGLWLYSYLHNFFGSDGKWLDHAKCIYDFMVSKMYAGKGRWFEKVTRDGKPKGGIGVDVFGWLFCAAGLMQYYRAADDDEALKLAKESLLAALSKYDMVNYAGVEIEADSGLSVSNISLRSQGHSMVVVWMLTEFLSFVKDEQLEKIQAEHVSHLVNDFWNDEYEISNEYLRHDHARFDAGSYYMFTGHSVEVMWMLLHEAVRLKDDKLFDEVSRRLKILLDKSWDEEYGGIGTEGYFAVEGKGCARGQNYQLKTMWAQVEVLIGCLTVLEYRGSGWAAKYYDKTFDFVMATMPKKGHGIWRQATDRAGKDIKRPEFSIYRKGNFHQPRFLMLNMLSLKRLIENKGQCISF